MVEIFDLEKVLKARLVTSEFRILMYIYLNGPTRSSNLFAPSGASPANFQNILRKMRTSGLITANSADLDGRVRIYDMDEKTRQHIDELINGESEPKSDRLQA